jgi:hypothetical protein
MVAVGDDGSVRGKAAAATAADEKQPRQRQQKESAEEHAGRQEERQQSQIIAAHEASLCSPAFAACMGPGLRRDDVACG